MMAKFDSVHGLFKYVKKESFMLDYGGINPKGGFNHRFCGTDTNGVHVKELTENDKRVIADGLDGFIVDCLVVRDGIRKELENKIK